MAPLTLPNRMVPVEIDNMMQPVKAMTQPDPIDGLRFNISVQPLKVFRASATWKYATFAGKQYFSACAAAMNPKEDVPAPYNDFVAGEFSGDKGVTVTGSYIPIPQWGVMLKGEGNLRDVKDIKSITYTVESRKMFGPIHVGVFKKNDSFGVNYLHRANPFFSYGTYLELFVSIFW